ncbi:MAG: fumarylacetoacetate hydrolase family protein [Planctomycetes bacterium]|nr:fumarylacetoacetate hydrolase family protein [Planctomycetota bacterium]
MRFCVVQIVGERKPSLAIGRAGGLAPIDAPPSLREALDNLGPEALRHRGEEYTTTLALDCVETWLPPVPDPRTFRDFYAFEQHVRAARQKRGLDMIPEWYKFPVFYFSNPTTLRGHNQPVKKPAATRELDFELEIAAIIGRQVQDVSGQAAEHAIFGFTVLNDLSARDLQREEMKCQLGPAKGKDFASAIGPCVVTCDELADRRVGPGRYDLTMIARKNGREISRGNMRDLYWDFTQMIARASQDAPLFPGDLIGSGTVGTGCVLELGPEATDGWLEPGDVIELEIEQIGVLRTPIVP